MSSIKTYFHLVVFASCLSACSSEETIEPLDEGYDYFPLQTGIYQIYTVDETTYDAINGEQHSQYELKTLVVDSFQNQAGGHTFVMHNFKRENASSPWQYAYNSSATLDAKGVVVTEQSRAIKKLAFPLAANVSWDGNAPNAEEEDEFVVTQLDQSTAVNGLAFEKTLTVEQEMYDDQLTRTDERTERYARGIGLISRQVRTLAYCTEQICLDDQIIETGLIIKQEIIAYGNE